MKIRKEIAIQKALKVGKKPKPGNFKKQGDKHEVWLEGKWQGEKWNQIGKVPGVIRCSFVNEQKGFGFHTRAKGAIRQF